ncbi:hypothetical protein KFK09_012624 [Dendrobium nobile]|uniref:DUF7866 domain-containing protein n=1 Tax=Dendrobium nobile TaxID=94219 RepID=A0A8T3BI90_DENNO|nr:hypothetical protein KFK09_012624 [Dendrobium nobile]
MATISISTIFTFPLLLLLFLPIKADYFLPSSTTIEYRQIEGDAIAALQRNHGVFAPYRTCSNCECCSPDDSKICSMMKCCFGIVCNLPNKPFGYCSFMPLSCHCNSCN